MTPTPQTHAATSPRRDTYANANWHWVKTRSLANPREWVWLLVRDSSGVAIGEARHAGRKFGWHHYGSHKYGGPVTLTDCKVKLIEVEKRL